MITSVKDNMFITILEITKHGIREILNTELDRNKDIHRYHGFEFKILYIDNDYAQLFVYAYNPYTTMLLGGIDKWGIKCGVKIDVPTFFETEGGFAAVLCTYIFMLSKQPIDLNQVYQVIGVGTSWEISAENYWGLRNVLLDYRYTVGFSELMHYVDYDEELCRDTQRMVEHTMLYKESYVSCYRPVRDGLVSLQKNSILRVAKAYAEKGKRVAVLNSANPVNPGGEMLKGTMEQEERLCRESNLYKALVSANANEYYILNNQIIQNNQFNSMFIGTDMVIYSPKVMVLKDNDEYLNSPYYVDVLTCAAPFFSGSGYILPNGDLEYLLKRRIRNIFEVAIENGVEVLVLGAFGCGSFHNPPSIVASAFRSVLLEQRYAKVLDMVIFAIEGTDITCPNTEAFEYYFSMFPEINTNGEEKNRSLGKKI